MPKQSLDFKIQICAIIVLYKLVKSVLACAFVDFVTLKLTPQHFNAFHFLLLLYFIVLLFVPKDKITFKFHLVT